MTPEQQRIAIAEACGWRGRDHHPLGILSDTGVYKVYSKKGYADTTLIPDFLNDLNAMHEAEKTLTASQWAAYVVVLETVCHKAVKVRATAAQRAEAFLKTLDLYKP